MRQLTAGSLFAGIGGFELGFARAGITTSWSVEKNEWCQRVLKKNFPHTQIHGDIFDVGAHNLEPVDIISGGFPCQPFSSAGKRGGTKDDRYLWPEMLRVVQALRPTWVVAENVYGLTVGEMESTFDQVLFDLEGAGYDTGAFVIPACGVDAPHIRQRVWIVAHSESERRTEARPISTGRPKRVSSSCAKSQNVANSNGSKPQDPGQRRTLHYIDRQCAEKEPGRDKFKPGLRSHGEDVANTDFQGLEVGQCKPGEQAAQRIATRQGGNVSDTKVTGEQQCGWQQQQEEGNRERDIHIWQPEPGIHRVANGVPRRVDRIRGLGNAIVPQQAELIGRYISHIEYQKLNMRLAA